MDDGDKGWNHLVKVLRLTEEQQRTLESRGVDDVYLFHGSAGLGKVDFFAFDNETNTFPNSKFHSGAYHCRGRLSFDE